jgi:hypothetical protein
MQAIWSRGGHHNRTEWIVWGGVGFGSVQEDLESGEEVQRRLGMRPPVLRRIRRTREFFAVDGGDVAVAAAFSGVWAVAACEVDAMAASDMGGGGGVWRWCGDVGVWRCGGGGLWRCGARLEVAVSLWRRWSSRSCGVASFIINEPTSGLFSFLDEPIARLVMGLGLSY